MSKYEPLEKFLKDSGYARVPMTFSQIESIIEGLLPASARKHRAWWSNNPSNSVITHAWLGAGFKTAEVDLAKETLTFVRTADPRGNLPVSPSSPTPPPTADAQVGAHPILGALRGSVTVPKGYDLTQPADPDWGAAYE